MIILSTFKSSFWVTFFASSTLVIGAVYTLWMYRRVFYGEAVNPGIAYLKDVRGVDFIIFSLLTAAVIFFGVYPNAMLDLFHASVDNILRLALQSKLPIT